MTLFIQQRHWQLNLNTENVMIHNLTSSIAETCDFHMHLYDEQKQEHGQPKVINTLVDTDPDSTETKKNAKQMYVAQLRSIFPIVLLYGTLTFALLFLGLLLPISIGIALLAFLLIAGISFSLVDYETLFVRFKPINERKSRKAKV